MNFKTIDTLFLHIKKLIMILVFISLFLSVVYFIYWLIVSMKITLPDAINNILLIPVDFLKSFFKNAPELKDMMFLLPVSVSLVFIILTYILNCVLQYVEFSHRNYQKYVEDYKANLEAKINTQLKKNFVQELEKTEFFATKLKVEAESPKSYLKQSLTDEEKAELENKIIREISDSLNFDLIVRKGTGASDAYFICKEPKNASEFYATLVNKTIKIINKYINERVKINFYCAVDVFDTAYEANFKLIELDKIIDIRVKNKILVAPRFKTFFRELYPGYFTFKLLGEYNFSKNTYKSNYINIYTLHRRSK